eukprot:5733855-Amphidinium_carterae.1
MESGGLLSMLRCCQEAMEEIEMLKADIQKAVRHLCASFLVTRRYELEMKMSMTDAHLGLDNGCLEATADAAQLSKEIAGHDSDIAAWSGNIKAGIR